MKAYLHTHCNDFIPDYGFICCVFLCACLFTVSDDMQCVCVCVPLWPSGIRPPKSHDQISLATHTAEGPSSIILSILHCLLWEWWNFSCSHHR